MMTQQGNCRTPIFVLRRKWVSGISSGISWRTPGTASLQSTVDFAPRLLAPRQPPPGIKPVATGLRGAYLHRGGNHYVHIVQIILNFAGYPAIWCPMLGRSPMRTNHESLLPIGFAPRLARSTKGGSVGSLDGARQPGCPRCRTIWRDAVRGVRNSVIRPNSADAEFGYTSQSSSSTLPCLTS
jgi:hypothetical protein